MVSRQFQVFRNPYPQSAAAAPFLVVLQSDSFDEYESVIVAPLVATVSTRLAKRLRPRFEIEGRVYFLNVLQMAPMHRGEVGAAVAELDRFKVIEAYDALISGA